MALYGTGGTGIPFTGFTPTLNDLPIATLDSTSGAVQKNGLMQSDAKFNRITRGTYNQVLLSKFQSLIGQVTGAVGVTATKRRVQGSPQVATPASPDQGGGVVTIETHVMINRASNVADFNNLFAITTFVRRPNVYAPDISGNSGGGKLGY